MGNYKAIVSRSEPAKPGDYIPVIQELEKMGFRIKVIQRASSQQHARRKTFIQSWKLPSSEMILNFQPDNLTRIGKELKFKTMLKDRSTRRKKKKSRKPQVTKLVGMSAR